MAALPVRITGSITKSDTGEKEACEILGLASIEGLEIGGGPVFPPPGGGGEQPPTERPPGQPTFPIWGPPGVVFPPNPGYPPVAGHPLPEPPAGVPPDSKPEPGWEAKAVWTPNTGWVVVLVPKEGTNVPTPSK